MIKISFFILIFTTVFAMDANEYGQFRNMIDDIDEIKQNIKFDNNYIQNNKCNKRKSYLKKGQENTTEIDNFLQYQVDKRNAEIEYQNCIRNNKNKRHYNNEEISRQSYTNDDNEINTFEKTDFSKGNKNSPQIIVDDLHLYNVTKITKFRHTKDKVMIKCANGTFMLPKQILKNAKIINFTENLNDMLKQQGINTKH